PGFSSSSAGNGPELLDPGPGLLRAAGERLEDRALARIERLAHAGDQEHLPALPAGALESVAQQLGIGESLAQADLGLHGRGLGQLGSDPVGEGTKRIENCPRLSSWLAPRGFGRSLAQALEVSGSPGEGEDPGVPEESRSATALWVFMARP